MKIIIGSAEEAKLMKEYPYIVAWGQMMGSYRYYVVNQVRQAKEDNAPPRAVYKNKDHAESKTGWVTIDECCKPTQYEIDAYIKGHKGGALI